jgi:hypothetical protein
VCPDPEVIGLAVEGAALCAIVADGSLLTGLAEALTN